MHSPTRPAAPRTSPAALAEADLDHLAQALVRLLLAAWRRRVQDEKEAAPTVEFGAAGEVRNDAAVALTHARPAEKSGTGAGSDREPPEAWRARAYRP